MAFPQPLKQGPRLLLVKWKKRRFNPRLHIHKIVALSEIYGEDAVDRAIRDACFSRLSPLNTSPISSNSAPESSPNPALCI